MFIKRHATCTPEEYAAMRAYIVKHNFKFNVHFNIETEKFEFIYTMEEDYYTSVMNDLKELQQNTDNYEFYDSLNTAIAAVKTIADMKEDN